MTGQVPSPPLGLDDVFILHTRDGSETLYRRQIQSTYHSVNGAVTESKHVFIQNGLSTQTGKSPLRILEFGFGTGLNAFLAYLFARQNEKVITYTGIEASPIALEVAVQLDYPGYLKAESDRDLFLRMHSESGFEVPHFRFHRYAGWEWYTEGISFDCIFFDAFAPNVQPEVWTRDIFQELFKVTAPLGCLITYCARGEVRRNMQKAGFIVDRVPGAPGKREMLRAIHP